MNKKDISVIVQGAVDKNETPKSLSSIRRHLPGAEIILSTWEGTDISGLAGLYDTVVFSKDPGTAIIEIPGSDKIIYNNMNRQLLSTQEGLKKATNKYAMKLRSDLILTGDQFLNYFDQFPARTQNYNLFKHKILAPTIHTRLTIPGKRLNKTRENINTPFHISDWWLFGLKEDLNTYFLDTKLPDEPDFSNYFHQEKNKDKPNPYGTAKFRFAPEQYFGYACFARHFKDIHMEDAADHDEQLTEKYKECLVNNFIILEFKQSGIYLNKYPFSKNEKLLANGYLGLYHAYRYETEYRRICDNRHKVEIDSRIFEDEKYARDLLRIYKHRSYLTDPKTGIPQKLEQLILGIPVSSILFFLKHFRKILSGTGSHSGK